MINQSCFTHPLSLARRIHKLEMTINSYSDCLISARFCLLTWNSFAQSQRVI